MDVRLLLPLLPQRPHGAGHRRFRLPLLRHQDAREKRIRADQPTRRLLQLQNLRGAEIGLLQRICRVLSLLCGAVGHPARQRRPAGSAGRARRHSGPGPGLLPFQCGRPARQHPSRNSFIRGASHKERAQPAPRERRFAHGLQGVLQTPDRTGAGRMETPPQRTISEQAALPDRGNRRGRQRTQLSACGLRPRLPLRPQMRSDRPYVPRRRGFLRPGRRPALHRGSPAVPRSATG